MAAKVVPAGTIGLSLQAVFTNVTIDEAGTRTEAALDISSASDYEIYMQRRGGSQVTFAMGDCSFESDGTDGVLLAETTSGQLDTVGAYDWWAKAVIGAYTYPTLKKTFHVRTV